MRRRVLVVLGPLALLATAGCGGGSVNANSSAGSGSNAGAGPSEVTTGSGLKYQDVQVGSGAEARAGQTAVVHYTGWLTNGTKFDSSKDRNQPFSFALGRGQVIKGWDEGVVGMKVGGKRVLTVPPELGYGARGTPGGPIPPNATLRFEVDLLDVR